MATIDDLLGHFRKQTVLPWQKNAPPDYRVWILHYDRALERRVQGRLDDFKAAAVSAGHGWDVLDLAPLVPSWFACHELFEGLVQQPDELPGLLPEFQEHAVATARRRLDALGEQDILALAGVGALFGLLRVSALIERIAPNIKGRLLVLFPGCHEGGVYRLLDARDGWSYRAVPIPA